MKERHARLRYKQGDAVPPLAVTISRTVRLEEVDPLGIMWHGRYASWLEDGREAFGKTYGMSYLAFQEAGVLVPIKLFQLNFLKPLTYPNTYTLRTELCWNPSAVLDFRYTILDAEGTSTTVGSTTQLMVDRAGELLLEPPPLYRTFCEHWATGVWP